MTVKPILFSGEMVCALLDGRKTQTRRVMKPQPEQTEGGAWYWRHKNYSNGGGADYFHTPNLDGIMAAWIRAMPYAVGDLLYVREAWRPHTWDEYGSFGIKYLADDSVSDWLCPPEDGPDWLERIAAEMEKAGVKLNADGCYESTEALKNRPSIHMPRWASRMTLEITDVRVQQLLDISEEDAQAEGFAPGILDDGFAPQDIGGGCTIESSGTHASAAGLFQIGWSDMYPDWDGFSSPWVIAVTFKVHKINIDEHLKAPAPLHEVGV